MSEMQEHRTLIGEDIVCVGFAEWTSELPTGQQNLMLRLAQTNRILFIEALGVPRLQVAMRDPCQIGRRLRHGLRGVRAEDEVTVLSPVALPILGSGYVGGLSRWLLQRQVAQAASRLGFHRPILWTDVPHADALIETLDPSLVVYHCVEDVGAQKVIDTKRFRSLERRLLARAELVLASTPELAERLSRSAETVVYAPGLTEVTAALRRLRPIAEPRWSGEDHVVDRDDPVDVTAEVKPAPGGEAAETGDLLTAGDVA
jgi:hypothetical protein